MVRDPWVLIGLVLLPGLLAGCGQSEDAPPPPPPTPMEAQDVDAAAREADALARRIQATEKSSAVPSAASDRDR